MGQLLCLGACFRGSSPLLIYKLFKKEEQLRESLEAWGPSCLLWCKEKVRALESNGAELNVSSATDQPWKRPQIHGGAQALDLCAFWGVHIA